MSNTIQFPQEALENEYAKQMSLIAKQQVTARLYDGGDLYLFGSEIACLRIAQSHQNIETKVMYSENLKTYFCALYFESSRK